MNLNKWLCKTFDTDKKGYVTVMDIVYVSVDGIFPYLLMLLIISFVFTFGGILLVQIQNLDTSESIETIPELFYVIAKAWLMPALIIISCAMVIYVMHKISQIKIAKCPLKENENDIKPISISKVKSALQEIQK